tara:strand:+ start:2335 stop:2574 length:240 start_codon:yes stop_codon:yes gene_type:complete
LTLKVTPKGDLSWHLKWIATALIVIAIVSRSFDISSLIDVGFSIAGSLLWAVVGVLWRDRSLFVLNAVIICLLVAGLFQ